MNWFSRRRRLARLRSALRSRPHTILLFHSVGRPASADFLPAGLDCPVELFEEILKFLSGEAEVVTLSAVLKKPGSVVLTFDDGFRDNFTIAFPLLRQYKLPATIFVAADAVDAEKLLPIHRYYFARQTGGTFADSIDSPARRAEVDKYLRDLPAPGELYLRSDELRAMADAGIEIGAHTCSHPWLAAWTAKDQRREIERSKEMLGKLAGRSVNSFAYPYGYRRSFNEASESIVAENFEFACLSDDSGAPDNPRLLPRVNLLAQ